MGLAAVPMQCLHSCSCLQAVQNPEISKRAKSLFFTNAVLQSMAQFLIQEEGDVQLVAQGDEQGAVPLSVLCFHLLMQLCTNFQTGVCYRSKWNQVTERRYANWDEYRGVCIMYYNMLLLLPEHNTGAVYVGALCGWGKCTLPLLVMQ